MRVIFTILASVFCVVAGAEEIDGYAKTILLPVNWVSTDHYNLSVKIPDGFKAIQPMLDWEDSPIVEFIPNDETENNWSEIITINKFIGQKIPAIQFVAYLKELIKTQSKNMKVIKDTSNRESSYEEAFLVATYDLSGKHEVLFSHFYSGPFDCVGIQYTIRPKEGMSDEQTISKIENYFKQNVQLLKGNGQ